tara:strand:- start:998 stop:2011 length:1014 start_codon:yes stop_codon:yes gene_type:complete
MKNQILKLYSRNLNKIIHEGGKHPYVLLGESTHGTAEYFELRLKMTKDFITRFNFNIVFFETEWSLGYEINKYIHSESPMHLDDPTELLKRLSIYYPKWMLYNKYIRDLIIFMKKWNDTHKKKVYFYGIDCQNIELAKKNVCAEPHLNCNLVAAIIKNHKKMKKSSQYWDLRDTFWLHILESVKKNKHSRSIDHKCILWAHNSHIGNINAKKTTNHTVNIASLLEEIYPIYNIGFSTFNGTVRASNAWNQISRKYKLHDAIQLSYEYIFHQECVQNKWPGLIYVSDKTNETSYFYFRYIGVVYDKKNEFEAHYQLTNINKEYDVVVFIDHTNALELL